MVSGKGNYGSGEIEDAVFLGETVPWAAGGLYLSLHTAAIGAASAQNTSEATYTGYARVAMPTTGSFWSRVAQVMSNVNAVVFPTNTGSNQTVSYLGIGTAASGAGNLIYFGSLAVATSITTGTAPIFQPGQLSIAEG